MCFFVLSRVRFLSGQCGTKGVGVQDNAQGEAGPKPFPDSETFASAFGQAVWLMTVSKTHRDLPISEIEAKVSPAILLQQFRIYSKGKQPIAFLSWAAVSDEIAERFKAGDRRLQPHEWRSGDNIEIVECVSPFARREDVEKQFWESLQR